MLRAVLFDVDFTLSRPGPELGPEGYRRVGARHGLTLDPGRYEAARLGALDGLQHHPELEHDEEIWIAFTERIVRGMCGPADGARKAVPKHRAGGREADAFRGLYATRVPTSECETCATRACAVEIVGEWERHDNFTLYEDALPALEELRGRGLALGLVSNGQRDLEEFAAHHGLDVDVTVGSRSHGRTKPHASIFEAALAALGVGALEAAMVGDSPEDDIAGARALGMRAILLDREGRHAGEPDRITDLFALPAALGLA